MLRVAAEKIAALRCLCQSWRRPRIGEEHAMNAAMVICGDGRTGVRQVAEHCMMTVLQPSSTVYYLRHREAWCGPTSVQQEECRDGRSEGNYRPLGGSPGSVTRFSRAAPGQRRIGHASLVVPAGLRCMLLHMRGASCAHGPAARASSSQSLPAH